MPDLDLVIRNGTVVTAADRFGCDVGVSGGRIVALAEGLPRAAHEIDAAGRLVLPGGVDSHCHIEQLSGMGIWNADDFYSGTVAAAFGGTTTVIPFAAQHHGQSMREVVADYRERAKKAVVDHAFHMIVSDPTETVLSEELPALIRDGYSSLKLFMTYPLLRLDDAQMLDLLALARRERAMVSVHAENDAMLAWTARRLLERGHRAPKFHAISHPRVAEAEAVSRLIAMAALVDQPIVVFHVTTEGSMRAIRDAQTGGQKVFAETCPQYLLLDASDLDRPGLEGAKWMFSPPARDAADRAAIWRGVQNGTFQMVTSDHAPYRFDESGKLAKGRDPDFKQIANGIPGIELRLPLLFSEGVGKGRIDLERFVALGCTNPARIYGLHPEEGHDRDRVRRRSRDLGSREDGRDHRCDDPRRHRLLPVCGHDAYGLADHGDRARRGDRGPGRVFGPARSRPLSAARRRRSGAPRRPARPRDGPGAQLRRRTAGLRRRSHPEPFVPTNETT